MSAGIPVSIPDSPWLPWVAIHPPKSRVSWKQQSQPQLVVMEGGVVRGSTSWECLEIYLPDWVWFHLEPCRKITFLFFSDSSCMCLKVMNYWHGLLCYGSNLKAYIRFIKKTHLSVLKKKKFCYSQGPFEKVIPQLRKVYIWHRCMCHNISYVLIMSTIEPCC